MTEENEDQNEDQKDRGKRINSLKDELFREQMLQSVEGLDMISLLTHFNNILDVMYMDMRMVLFVSEEVKKRTLIDAEDPLDPAICSHLPPIETVKSSFNSERKRISDGRAKLFELMMNIREIEKIVVKSIENAKKERDSDPFTGGYGSENYENYENYENDSDYNGDDEDE